MQFFVQIGLKMDPGDCPSLNINTMRAISVKSFLNVPSQSRISLGSVLIGVTFGRLCLLQVAENHFISLDNTLIQVVLVSVSTRDGYLRGPAYIKTASHTNHQNQ